MAFTGAVEDYRPQNGTSYQPAVTRLIGAYPDPLGAGTTSRGDSFKSWDYFTYRRPEGGRGSIVYLGGHSYSGVEGTFQVAGSRLVLNTLFNLGASCTASGISCGTGLPGVCSAGTFQCQSGQTVCVPTVQPGMRTEICNGLDDDCDWEVDEGLQTECYEPPPGYVDPEGRTTTEFAASRNVGLCHPGISICQNVNGNYGMSACSGQVLPVVESCNAQDDDCDGPTDEDLSQACYDGPAGSICSQADLNAGVSCQLGQPKGACLGGTQVCQNGAVGLAGGRRVRPGRVQRRDLADHRGLRRRGGGGTAKDDDCDGRVNNGCSLHAGSAAGVLHRPWRRRLGDVPLRPADLHIAGTWGPCPTDVDDPDAQVVAEAEPCYATTVYVVRRTSTATTGSRSARSASPRPDAVLLRRRPRRAAGRRGSRRVPLGHARLREREVGGLPDRRDVRVPPPYHRRVLRRARQHLQR